MIVIPDRRKVAKDTQYPQAALKKLDVWYASASKANWQNPLQVKNSFPTADPLKGGKMIFDIGSKYRLLTRIDYERGAIEVLFFGHHDEYDKQRLDEY